MQSQSILPSPKWERKGVFLARNFDGRPLLVSTLDGKISAIDKDSGKVLWTFDSQHNLIQASASSAYGLTVVPGVQGELYTQSKDDTSQGFTVCSYWNSHICLS